MHQLSDDHWARRQRTHAALSICHAMQLEIDAWWSDYLSEFSCLEAFS